MNTTMTLSKKLLILSGATFSLLLIPLIAMQFTDEVVWSAFDFIIAGLLLFGTGFGYLLITIKAENFIYKVASGLALASGLFLVWANLAVGLIGSENNPENLMYFGVILVGLVGAGISRFKARGMSITMFAMAGSMVLIAIIAFMLGAHNYPYSSVLEILGVTGFFSVPFVLSALLFHNVAGPDTEGEINE